MLTFKGLWEKIISYSQQNQIDFTKYFECHQIKKLRLSDLTIFDVKSRVIEF